MSLAESDRRVSFVSTGVAAQFLGLDSGTVRAMIETGTLPTPQWMTLGHRIERIYSIEWLRLAGEAIDVQRLAGLELGFESNESVQFVVRFNRAEWSLSDVASTLTGVNELWALCGSTLDPEAGPLPELNVRRLSAGSPMDLYAWVQAGWGALGTGVVAALFTYVIKNPDKVAEALPRMVAGWREQWTRADEARIAQLMARSRRKTFEEQARSVIELFPTVTATSLSGDGTSNLDLAAPRSVSTQPGLARDPDAPPIPEMFDLDQ
ncbi:hypothetical protein KXS11_06125 [Plantibacter flavus]|uniref:hypothetical protein n=1 Tax=Plantibacter flavus TaxID=150123 RepID=UPI003F18789F